MIILGIDTSTDVCSVALFDESGILSHKSSEKDFSHASLITIFIEEILKEAKIEIRDISAISLSSGPGSYTGLRVGASVAKGLCFALDLPLIAIDSLTSLAYSITHTPDDAIIIPMIDARRMDVYTCVFDAQHKPLTEISKVSVIDDSYFLPYIGHDIYLCGDGYKKLNDIIKNYHPGSTSIDARNLWLPSVEKYKLGTFEDIAYFSPYYLNQPNITKCRKG